MSVSPVQIPVSTSVPTLTLAAGSAGGLAVAGSIDPVSDYLSIYTASATATQGINRNTLLGISSQPLGLTDTQSPTNKTFNNTNSYTTKDGSFTLQNTSDVTKQANFSLAGNTTGTTRTYTMPNASVTLASLTGTETLTNKTLTSPTISAPTITNATFSADAVTGFTTSNTGTVYGVSVTAGVINGANTIGNAALQTNAVQANQLSTSAITLGFAKITSNFTGTATSLTLITGLSIAVTVPSGGRNLKVTFVGSCSASAAAGNNFTIDIYDSTTTTEVASQFFSIPTASYTVNATTIAYIPAPSAGSHTYQARYTQSSAGTFTCNATSTGPAFILVELI